MLKVILDSHNGSYSAKAGAAMWVCSDCMLRSQPSSSTYCSTTKGSQGLVVDGSMLLKCAEALQPDTLSAEPAEPHVEIKGSRLCIIQ